MKITKYNAQLEEEIEAGVAQVELNRRDFIKISGAGIFIFFTVRDLPSALQGRRGRDYPSDFNAYLRIDEKGQISCFTGKIEMGQGIYTSLAQMLAEELNVSLSVVDIVMGDTSLCPYDGGTVGSRSTKYFGPALRKAAAEARAVLVQLAAEQLKLAPDELFVENGIIRHTKSNKQLSYGQLARGRKIMRTLPDINPKAVSKHTVSGKSTLRSDSLTKVKGEAKFAADIQLPGMLYAKILRPPAHRAKLKQVDLSAAEKIEGVTVVQDGDLVAVLHENPEQAQKALETISAEFEPVETTVNNLTVFDHLQEAGGEAEIEEEKGNIQEGQQKSTHSIESAYYNHYVAHAPMEPHTTVADFREDKLRIWAATQTPFRVQSMVAEEFDLPKEKVHVITPFLGGGFGGKKAGLDILQAVRLSKIAKKPIQVALTRKEEFFYDSFRPASVIKLKSGIDETAKITYWDFNNFYAGMRSSEPIYNIPHYRVSSHSGWYGDEDVHPFDVGAWRGPGSNSNVFAMESQTDIMAHAAGMDPLSFRLHNLTDQRMIRVLKAAAERFGVPFSAAPSTKGYGIACTNYLNTYVATIAQVQVDKQTGKVSVIRMVCAQDMGEIINPQGAKLQIEGGLTMGLGYALSEEIQFEGGHILTDNFDSYEFTKFSWAPRIDVALIDNPDLAPQGCGEPAITTTGAVIANAVYDAVGVRMYILPMTPQRIMDALKKI